MSIKVFLLKDCVGRAEDGRTTCSTKAAMALVWEFSRQPLHLPYTLSEVPETKCFYELDYFRFLVYYRDTREK